MTTTTNPHNLISPRATEHPRRHQSGYHQEHPIGIAGHLLARWPSIVGLGALTANAAGGIDSHVTAMVIVLAAMCYLAAAALGSRRSGWVMIGVAIAAVVIAGATGLDPTTTLLVIGGGFAVFGFLRGTRIDRRELVVQTLGFAGFSAIALVAMMSSPVLAAHLAALAAIGHAAWDAVHYFRERAVTRSFTEFCFILDLGLGALLLLTTWGFLAL